MAGRLSLDLVKYVVCRTSPERETLPNLLCPEIKQRWINTVIVDDGKGLLFNRNQGVYLREVNLDQYISQFIFESASQSLRGPFKLGISMSGSSGVVNYEDNEFYVPTEPFNFALPDSIAGSGYKITLRLNNDIAYIGKYRSNDRYFIPF